MNREERAAALFADILERHDRSGATCRCGSTDPWPQHVAAVLIDEARRQRVVVGRRPLF